MRDKTRIPGYYWVKHEPIDKWKIAQYTQEGLWYFVGCELGWESEDFAEIGAHILPPSE